MEGLPLAHALAIPSVFRRFYATTLAAGEQAGAWIWSRTAGGYVGRNAMRQKFTACSSGHPAVIALLGDRALWT